MAGKRKGKFLKFLKFVADDNDRLAQVHSQGAGHSKDGLDYIHAYRSIPYRFVELDRFIEGTQAHACDCLDEN